MAAQIADVRTYAVRGGGYVVVVAFDDGRQLTWPWIYDGIIIAPQDDPPDNDDVVRAMYEAVTLLRWHDEAAEVCNALGGVA